MYLENLVVDAQNPESLGRFWRRCSARGPTLTDEPDLFETRLTVPDGLVLDLCFQRVPEPVAPTPGCTSTSRRRPAGGGGAAGPRPRGTHLDIGQRDVPWVVLADPEGNPFCVMEERPENADLGPDRRAAARQRRPGPRRRLLGRAVRVAAGLFGDACGAAAPLGRGVLLELCPEPGPRPRLKNRLHLDIRLEAGDDEDAVVARVVELGGRELDPDWGALPWQVVTDPSGNELCLLPALPRSEPR